MLQFYYGRKHKKGYENMVGSAIKKYAKEKGLKVANGVAYGVVDGYMITLTDGSGIKTLSVSGAITDEIAACLEAKFQDKKFLGQYRIGQYKILRESVTIVFADTVGTMKKIIAFLEIFPAILSENGVLGDGFCTVCGNYIDAGFQSNVVLVNGVAHRVHTHCATAVNQRSEVENDIHKTEDKKLGRGIIGALLGSLLGGVVWAVAYYMGWFIALIGVLIGFLSKKGYELLGGKVCKAKTAIILVTTLIGAAFGQIAGDFAWIAQQTVLADPVNYSILDIPYNYIMILTNPEFTGSMIWSFVQGAFFALLGAYVILKKSHTENKDATLNTITLE